MTHTIRRAMRALRMGVLGASPWGGRGRGADLDARHAVIGGVYHHHVLCVISRTYPPLLGEKRCEVRPFPRSGRASCPRRGRRARTAPSPSPTPLTPLRSPPPAHSRSVLPPRDARPPAARRTRGATPAAPPPARVAPPADACASACLSAHAH